MKLSVSSTMAVLVACCAFSACDDNDVSAVATGPSSFRNELEFVGVSPSVSTWHDARLHTCSAATPFSFPFSVNVRAGALPLTLSEVRFHSTDPFRSTSPPTVFDSAGLTRQFASGGVTVARFSSRAFPFTHLVGCPTSGVVLHVSVKTKDSSGLERVSAVQVPMR